jgi:hypothetical protein
MSKNLIYVNNTWIKLHNGEFYKLYSLPNIISVME